MSWTLKFITWQPSCQNNNQDSRCSCPSPGCCVAGCWVAERLRTLSQVIHLFTDRVSLGQGLGFGVSVNRQCPALVKGKGLK